jgi:hypothetical protein
MPRLVMVPKINRMTASNPRNKPTQKHQESQQQSAASKLLHAYSIGEERFDSILAMNSPFIKKDHCSSNFVKKKETVAVDENDDDGFDPFKVGPTDGDGGGGITKNHSPAVAAVDALSTFSEGSAPVLIPPKMLVKFKVHEEVSSVASLSPHNEGNSKVYVQGTIQVRREENDSQEFQHFTRNHLAHQFCV